MKERTLFTIAALLSITGLLFLFFYAEELELKSVARLDAELPEEEIAVLGRITRLSVQENVTFLEIQGERIETIDVILFPEEKLLLREGDFVEIAGTVEEYQGKKEVIASSVTLK